MKKWDQIKSVKHFFTTETSEEKHIFITGAPRSGTTLIKTVLTAHPDLAGGDGESTGLFKIRDIYEYSNGEMENGWFSLDYNGVKNIIQIYDQLASKMLEHYNGKYFVDKIWPSYIRLKYVSIKFPNARWVHMIRDGRDSYCSALRHPNVPQSNDLKQFALYWQKCNRSIERIVPTEKRVLIRYEDLAADPETVISRVMDFLSLSAHNAQFYPAKSGKITTIHKREYHKRLSQPIDTKSVNRSQKELKVDDYNHITKLLANDLENYGYSV